MFPALAVSSLVMMDSAFKSLNIAMAIKTARMPQMNSIVVRYLLILHAVETNRSKVR
jgi:hypothetical protein